jgi:superfamily II DNA or RNA helicase
MYWRIKTFLKLAGHDVKIEFINNIEPVGDKEPSVNKLELKPFQIKATKIAVKKRYGIISAPMRAGKTAILSAIIRRINQFPVFVVTKDCDLVIQTKRDIQEHTGLNVGSFYRGEFSPGDIIVTHYPALPSLFNKEIFKRLTGETKQRNKNFIHLIQSAKVLLLDECHLAYAPETRKVLDNFTSIGYKIGVSGTPIKDDVPLKEAESVIGPILYSVKFDTLIKSNRIAQPIVHIYNLPCEWYTEQSKDYEYVYESDIVSNKNRNLFIARIVSELKKQNKTCFIMVQKLDHGRELNNLIRGSFFVHGSIDPSIREGLYKSLQDKKLHCVIGTVGKVGLNIPKLDAVINAEGLKSHVATLQKMRSLTATDGKTEGIIVDFIDNDVHHFLSGHSSKRFDEYSKIKGFIIKTKNVKNSFFEVPNG